jgi:hypothetical protein
MVAGLISLTFAVAGCTGVAPSGGSSATDLSTPTQSGSADVAATPTALPTPVATATPEGTPPSPETQSASPSTPAEVAGVAPVQLPSGLLAMTVTDGLRVRSQPLVSDAATIYQPTLPQGTRLRVVDGPMLASGYWWYRVTDLSVELGGDIQAGWVASADMDGTPWIGPSPEACRDYPYAAAEISIGTLAELQKGFQATWAGCLTTPWVEPYWVTVTFRDDGTYSAAAVNPPDGLPAFYYGTDADSPLKRYALNDLQDSLNGIGQIDIVFSATSVNRGELRNIKLMGDWLEFEFFHRGQYGPLTYRLYRIEQPR